MTMEELDHHKLQDGPRRVNSVSKGYCTHSSKNEQLKDLDKVQLKDLRTLPPELWNFIFRPTLGENERKPFLSYVMQHGAFNWSEHFLHQYPECLDIFL